MADEVPQRIAGARTMRDAFGLLRSYPTIGDFLAYQFVTDLNYSEITNFLEMEFVVPGPGALDGIHKCFSDLGGLTEDRPHQGGYRTPGSRVRAPRSSVS